MKALITLLILSISIGCAQNAKKQELDLRANYDEVSNKTTPVRKKQRVEKIQVGGRFLPSGDWFMGGWVLLVIEEADWVFDDALLRKSIK